MKLFWPLLLTACVLLLGAAACGGDDDSGDGSGSAPTDTAAGDDGEGEGGDGDSEETPDGGVDGGDGGSASPELEDYFRVMEEIGIRTDDELEAIQSDLNDGAPETDEEEIEAIREAFQRTGETLERSLTEAGDLGPPAEVQEAHQAFIETLTDFLALLSEFVDASDGVTSATEFETLINEYDPQLTDADDTFDDACLELQAIAVDNGIAADIRCGD